MKLKKVEHAEEYTKGLLIKKPTSLFHIEMTEITLRAERLWGRPKCDDEKTEWSRLFLGLRECPPKPTPPGWMVLPGHQPEINQRDHKWLIKTALSARY